MAGLFVARSNAVLLAHFQLHTAINADISVIVHKREAILELIARTNDSLLEAPRVYLDLHMTLLLFFFGDKPLDADVFSIKDELSRYLKENLDLVDDESNEAGFVLKLAYPGFIPGSQLPRTLAKWKFSTHEDRTWTVASFIQKLWCGAIMHQARCDEIWGARIAQQVARSRLNEANRCRRHAISQKGSTFGKQEAEQLCEERSKMLVNFYDDEGPIIAGRRTFTCRFSTLSDSKHMRVLYRGLGYCEEGVMDVLLVYHLPSRVFEFVVCSSEEDFPLARMYIRYHKLLEIVDQLKIQEVMYQITDSARASRQGKVDSAHALREATLQVMTSYLLSRLVVYRLRCVQALVVQIVAFHAEENTPVQCDSSPPPELRESLNHISSARLLTIQEDGASPKHTQKIRDNSRGSAERDPYDREQGAVDTTAGRLEASPALLGSRKETRRETRPLEHRMNYPSFLSASFAHIFGTAKVSPVEDGGDGADAHVHTRSKPAATAERVRTLRFPIGFVLAQRGASSATLGTVGSDDSRSGLVRGLSVAEVT